MNDDIRKAMAAILDWQTDCITMHFDTTEEEHAALEVLLLRLLEKPASAWVITKDYGYDCGRCIEGVASSLEKARGLVAVRCGRSDCGHMWCHDIDEYEMDVMEW